MWTKQLIDWGLRYDKVALLITRRHSEHGTRNCPQRLNQIFKTLIKRWIIDDSDESLNILEYIWWLFNSDF